MIGATSEAGRMTFLEADRASRPGAFAAYVATLDGEAAVREPKALGRDGRRRGDRSRRIERAREVHMLTPKVTEITRGSAHAEKAACNAGVGASLPAPTQGLRVTSLGEQSAVAVLPATHPSAADSAIALGRLAPERLVVLPREADPAFHNAVVAMCHAAGLSPAFVEIPEPRVEHVLLAVTAGAGPALLPEAVTHRFAAPGIRFVALEMDEPVLRSAVLIHPDTDSLATLAFLRAIARTVSSRAAQTPPAAVELVA
jgi:hypothetical protein